MLLRLNAKDLLETPQRFAKTLGTDTEKYDGALDLRTHLEHSLEINQSIIFTVYTTA